MKLFRLRFYILFILLLILSASALVYWNQYEKNKLSAEVQMMNEWYRLALEIETDVEGIAVPVAARFYGYFGFVPMSIHALINDRTGALEQQFPGLDFQGIETNKKIHFGPAFNKAAHLFLSRYYINIPYRLNEKAEKIHVKWNEKWMKDLGSQVTEDSKSAGRDIANIIYEWSEQDEPGHQAYLHNFEKEYKPPVGPGLWEVDFEHPMPALLPHWGNVRTFVIEPKEFIARPLPPFSADHNSIYYAQALELFTISSPLSYENKWISEFWSDDVRGLTFTPAGRWISILCQYIEQDKTETDKAIEAFFRLGIGLSDALVACWNSKYIYNLERPQDFIREHIHEDWRSFHHAPNFPSYPSGHSIIGGVSASILVHLFGDKIDFVDRSHQDRIEFIGKPRRFKSFSEMAEENAYSRIPLGVHFRMDCQEGLRLGKALGDKINGVSLPNVQKENPSGTTAPISGI